MTKKSNETTESANGANTAAFLVTLRELPSLYEDYVGYRPDIRPGGDSVTKGPVQPPVKGANNVGTQQPVLDPNCTFCEGETVSRAANQVPGINAVAGVHDTMQISFRTGFAKERFERSTDGASLGFHLFSVSRSAAAAPDESATHSLVGIQQFRSR